MWVLKAALHEVHAMLVACASAEASSMAHCAMPELR
jgi:hypothetical protein